MICHQIKTIEQAAELYQELRNDPTAVCCGNVKVSDYSILFVVEASGIFKVEILAAWGDKTKFGETVIEAHVDAYTLKPSQHVHFTYFECNREAILDLA